MDTGGAMTEIVAELPGEESARAVHAVRVARHRPLMETKFAVPWAAGMLVTRPRLTARLDRGADGQLTLVTGPAGAGKTALLASWVHGRRRAGRAAWVTLDDLDNDPASLWAYLLTALHRSTGGPKGPLGRLAAPVGGVDRYLINDLAFALGRLPAPVELVIDNVECLREGPAAESLAALLRHGVPMLRVVLGTRAPPPLPVGKLRLAGRVTEIDADDLAFTTAESAQLWRLRGLSITGDEADALVRRTDGLAAAVCFAAIAAGERTAAAPGMAPAGAAADDELVADFLRAEVFRAEPAAVREFLLRSSVVGEISADLANALTGRRDGPRMLDRLRRSGHVVRTAAPERGWLRYRRPLLDFLRREASIALSDELPELHRRAARWYAGHGEPMPAIRHAIAAGDPAYAAGVVVRSAAARVLGPDRGALRALTAEFSPLDALRDPEIAAVCALVTAERGDGRGTDGYADLVRQKLPDLPPERRLPLRAVLQLAAVLNARHRENWPGLTAAAGALTDLLDGAVPGLIPASAPLRAIALGCLGAARLWSGEFDAARSALRAAVVAAEHHRLDLAAADALGNLAVLHALLGHLPEAAEQAAAAVRLVEAAGQPRCGEAGLALAVLGLVDLLRGAPGDAARHLDAAVECEPRRIGRAVSAAVRARLLLSEGDPTGARRALAAARGGTDRRPPQVLRDWLAIADAEIRLAGGHPVAALTALSVALHHQGNPLLSQASVTAARAYLASASPARAASLAASVRRPGIRAGSWLRVQAWLVEALAADRLGHDGAVAIALSEAVSAAAADGIVEPFAAAGAPLAALLDRHREAWRSHGPFARRLEEVLPAPNTVARAEDRIVEPITEREGAVLRYLPTLLTMNDIARELSVSPNTVKSHLRSIYRKLAVGTRRDAVHRARELGLLWR
jgi:LuxR family maltose regulon positive regulatory protein